MRVKIVYDGIMGQLYCYIFEKQDGEEVLVEAFPLLDEESEDEETTIH